MSFQERRAYPPRMPRWFLILFIAQLCTNVLVWVVIGLVQMKIAEFWSVDSRNTLVRIKQLEIQLDDIQHVNQVRRVQEESMLPEIDGGIRSMERGVPAHEQYGESGNGASRRRLPASGQ